MGRLLLSMDYSVNFGHGGDLVAPLLLKIKLFLYATDKYNDQTK